MNPKTFDSEAGFAGGAPKRIIGMLLLQVFVEYAIGRTGLSTEESARAGTTEARSKTNNEESSRDHRLPDAGSNQSIANWAPQPVRAE